MYTSEIDTLQKYFRVKSQLPETNLSSQKELQIQGSSYCLALPLPTGASLLGLEGVLD